MTLDELRKEIDAADRAILDAFEKRMEISARIGEYKKLNGQEVLDTSREEEKIRSLRKISGDVSREYIGELYQTIFKISRDHQKKKMFGVLGKSLPHTYSPAIHHLIANEYLYTVIERTEEELDALFTSRIYGGFNVTIPYKREAARRCDVLSPEASETGAVNTVVFGDDGKVYGYNTDIFGFEYMLTDGGIDPRGKNCLIIGHGGASVAAEYALRRMGAGSIAFCSRREEINLQNAHDKVPGAQILINCTPVGMFPGTDASPLDISLFTECEAAVDLIYNPGKTLFLQQAEDLGIRTAGGLTMLVAQAAKASELFLGEEGKTESIRETAEMLKRRMKNITLIGMPGCGKSVLAKRIAEETGRELIDLDAVYTEEFGERPSETIEKYGEDVFRDNETEIASRYLAQSGKVISCGGGIVTRGRNRRFLRMNSEVIWLQRPLEALSSADRPLSHAAGVEKLYAQRKDSYGGWSDISIEIGKKETKEEFLDEAMEKLRSEGIL